MLKLEDRQAVNRASAAKMLQAALSDRNMTWDQKAAMVLDWAASDGTDEQIEQLSNRIGRVPGERIRGGI